MNYTHKIDRLPIGEQEEVTKIIFNVNANNLALVKIGKIEKPLQRCTQSPTFQVARLFCNLFETGSASEWLLYISEWDAPGGGIPLSNIRVTTKVVKWTS